MNDIKNNSSLTIKITKDTRDLLDLIKSELLEIYGEDFQNDDNLLTFLISYYYKKP